jgi:hypothetical protein
MTTASNFRHFCNDKWYEHLDEKSLWEGKAPAYNSEVYFHRNKWLLKKMYLESVKEQFALDNQRKIQKELKRGFKKGNL